MKTVVMSDAVTQIGHFAFSGCHSLKMTLPADLTTIGIYAFSGCELLEEIPALTKLEFIGECAFYGCKSIKEIPTLKKLETVGAHAFERCTSLTTVYQLPALKETGSSLFYKCTSLKVIHWAESMEGIGFADYNQSMEIYLDTSTLSSWFCEQDYRGCIFYVSCSESELQFEDEATCDWRAFKERNTFIYHYSG